jgi:hypothetical protein
MPRLESGESCFGTGNVGGVGHSCRVWLRGGLGGRDGGGGGGGDVELEFIEYCIGGSSGDLESGEIASNVWLLWGRGMGGDILCAIRYSGFISSGD